MHEHAHNKLDDIFREGLTQGNFSYNPDAWNQLTPALDRIATSRRRLFVRIASVAVLALFLIAAFLLKNDTTLYPQTDYLQESVKKVSPDNSEKHIKSVARREVP